MKKKIRQLPPDKKIEFLYEVVAKKQRQISRLTKDIDSINEEIEKLHQKI